MTMPSLRPRSKQQRGRSRGCDPSNRADQKRVKRESPRPLLVCAIIMTLAAAIGDWVIGALFLGSHQPGSQINLDFGVPVMGLACTILAVMAWRAWWRARGT